MAALTSCGLAVTDTETCWVLVHRPGLRELLAPQGIVVRDCTSFGMSGVARVAVPDDDGRARLVAALERVSAVMRPLMVLGCTSNAGKSLLVTALVRSFARRGVDVVPFKAQNMSNNARVVAGGEIGVAQWLQARAAGLEPDVRMNPVLLKPEADTRSQVVVDGVARPDLTAMPWRDRGPHLWPAMTAAFDGLRRDHELVIIEGAGSPAEINLPDLVNNRVLAHADAAALLVADIDRGGAFAHLYGTWALVPDTTRQPARRLRPQPVPRRPQPARTRTERAHRRAPAWPTPARCRCSTTSSPTRREPPSAPRLRARRPHVAVVRYPYASNLDELHLLAHVAHVRFAHRPADLAGADLVVLPGSKHVAADIAWLRRQRTRRRSRATTPPPGDSCSACAAARCSSGTASTTRQVSRARPRGSGCSPFDTVMHPTKLTRPTTIRFHDLPAPWRALDGLTVTGYEIRNGRLTAADDADADGALQVVADGTVLATTVHGLLEDPAVLAALFGAAPERRARRHVRPPRRRRRRPPRPRPARPARRLVIPDGVAAAAAVAPRPPRGRTAGALAPGRLVRHRDGAPRAAHVPRRPHRRDRSTSPSAPASASPPARRCGACSGGPPPRSSPRPSPSPGGCSPTRPTPCSRPLAAGDLDAARARLAGLVGRDVTRLDGAGIVRAVVETVAENTVDAVTAPLWWATVGGAPAVLAHRADQHPRRHGRPPRRPLPALRMGVGPRRRRRQLDPGPPHRSSPSRRSARARAAAIATTVRRDAPRHPSPNGGVVEAAFAAALDVRLGGTNTYGDVVEDRGTLGDGRTPTPADGAAAIRLARDVTGALACAVAVGAVVMRRRHARAGRW